MSRSALALFALVPVLAVGCGTKPPKSIATGTTVAAVDPWPQAVATLRKETDLTGCRRALTQLDNDLAGQPDPTAFPSGLAPAAEPTYQKLLGASPEEMKEIRGSSYTQLDSQYLAECFYLRDVVRTLDAAGMPPQTQALRAFEWTCRQVVLQPWLTAVRFGAGQIPAQVPTSYVLRRGSGSGLERAYVFLGLLQQLGLDGCLIGGAKAAEEPSWAGPQPGPEQPPMGPFWAVGVRVGADLFLFDPWKGSPVPTADGQGIATLAQVIADPTKKEKGTTVVLTAPVSATAPRMIRLEAALKAEIGIRLAIDPAALQRRFATEAKLADVAFWHPAGDPFCYPRVLSSFLPTEEGGTPIDPSLFNRYKVTMLPVTALTMPADLLPNPEEPGDIGVPEAAERLRLSVINDFAIAFLTDPSPRERAQRGQFAEVTPILVDRRKEFATAQERVRTDRNREATVKEWCQKARTIYARYSKARAQEKSNSTAAQEAADAVNQFWKNESATTLAIIDGVRAEAGLPEATYLLALSRHELAEQAQVRADRVASADGGKAAARAIDAWAEAAAWWDRYLAYAASQEKTFPGRTAHAQALAARAARFAKP